MDRATKVASNIVRNYGLGLTLARIDAQGNGGVTHVTNLEDSNTEVELILQEQFARARDIIDKGQGVFKRIVNTLLKDNTVTQQQFIDMTKGDLNLSAEIAQYPFNAKWNEYVKVV